MARPKADYETKDVSKTIRFKPSILKILTDHAKNNPEYKGISDLIEDFANQIKTGEKL